MDSSFRVALYSRDTITRPWSQDGGAFALPATMTFRAAQVMYPFQQHRTSTVRDDLIDVAVPGRGTAGRSTGETVNHLLLARHQHDLSVFRAGAVGGRLEPLDLLHFGRQLRHHNIVSRPQVRLRHADRE